jgi:hypothetical protein
MGLEEFLDVRLKRLFFMGKFEIQSNLRAVRVERRRAPIAIRNG